MKKTTYAIIGLIASGFVIIPALMLVEVAVGVPYDPANYYPPVVETTDVEAVDTVVEVLGDTVCSEPDLIP